MKQFKLGFFALLFVASVLTSFCCFDTSFQKEKLKNTGIDRTLYLLNSSTREHQNDVEILFYGQSIIGGMKTNILVDSLKARFPFARITYKHKAIGGFTIPDLIKTTPHDIYQENPDLIVFHAYGGINDGLYDSLINNIRKRLSSEILLLDHHYVWDVPKDRLTSINKSHDFDSKAIQKIAKKYHCGFVNVREQWKIYLDKNVMSPNELVGNTIDPNVHPNEKGNNLLRQIVLSQFPKTKEIAYDVSNESQRVIITPNELKKAITIPPFATSAELFLKKSKLINNEVYAEVLIDGKRPSEFRDSYHIERPSNGFQSWMPGISMVTLGEPFPITEEWTIIVFDIDRENNKFKFKLQGKKTGFDGEGNNLEKFESNSKRIAFDGANFNLFRIERILKNQMPENFEIKFRVRQIIKDTIKLEPNLNKYKIFRSKNSQKTIHKLNLNIIGDKSKVKNVVISTPYPID